MIEGAELTRDSAQNWVAKFYKNTNLRSIKSYLAMGDGANKPANAPTAAEPNAINPSGMVAAVLMLK